MRVVKHGNRSISSRSGSADLLECLGLPQPLDEKRSGECLAATGFTFLFAPHYHPAMKEIAPVRRTLGVRTVFNLLGPLTNPAEPAFGLIGAYSRDAARLMAETLPATPIQRVFVVHGEPGWDEPTPCGPFELYVVTPGHVVRTERDPLAFGLERCTPQSLAGGGWGESVDCIHQIQVIRKSFDDQEVIHSLGVDIHAGRIIELPGRGRLIQIGLIGIRTHPASDTTGQVPRPVKSLHEIFADHPLNGCGM